MAIAAAQVQGGPGDRTITFELAILVLIWLNVIALVLESVQALQLRYGPAFRAFEIASVAIFTVEYLLRFRRGGLRFATRPMGVIDLLAIAPFYLPMLPVDLRVLRIFRSFRIARLFQVAKVGRYSTALHTFGRVIVARRGELVSSALIMVMLLLVASTTMFYAEHAAQPEAFSSIPATMWWAAATLTTVGYGDMIPITGVGRVLGAVIAVLGIAMFALPTGILGAAFLEEYQRTREPRCPHCGR